MRKLTGQQLYRIVKAGIDMIKAGDVDGAMEAVLRIPPSQLPMVMDELERAIADRRKGDSR